MNSRTLNLSHLFTIFCDIIKRVMCEVAQKKARALCQLAGDLQRVTWQVNQTGMSMNSHLAVNNLLELQNKYC